MIQKQQRLNASSRAVSVVRLWDRKAGDDVDALSRIVGGELDDLPCPGIGDKHFVLVGCAVGANGDTARVFEASCDFLND
jgi:hypothetical protein